MVHHFVCATAIVLFVASSYTGASAQDAPREQLPPSQSPSHPLGSGRHEVEADKAMQTPSGKAGREEPSSHTPTVPPTDTMVFVNGALAVPGAPQNTDTVPAKYSAQNAADDKLITVAYTFKTLPNDQRQAIYQALKDKPADAGFNAQIGDVLPFTVVTQAVPADLAGRIASIRGYHFVVADHRVLLVSAANRVVMGEITATRDTTTGAGDRAR